MVRDVNMSTLTRLVSSTGLIDSNINLFYSAATNY